MIINDWHNESDGILLDISAQKFHNKLELVFKSLKPFPQNPPYLPMWHMLLQV